jgi:hypothetical protein
MEEIRLLIDFSQSQELSAPVDREAFIREAVVQLREILTKKQVNLTVIIPYEYDETIANNSKLSDWANEDGGSAPTE